MSKRNKRAKALAKRNGHNMQPAHTNNPPVTPLPDTHHEIGGSTAKAEYDPKTQVSKFSPPCHDGPQFAFELGKSRIWGSKADDVKDTVEDWDLMIPLVGDHDTYTPRNHISSNDEAKDLLPLELTEPYIPAILSIDWPDFGVPFISAVWWKGLVRFLQDFDGEVVFFCQGGHGRTGTALTIVSLLGDVNSSDAVECPLYWIRENYCDHAVETFEQVDYIEKLTGKQIWSQPYYEGYAAYYTQTPLANKSYSSYPAISGKKI